MSGGPDRKVSTVVFSVNEGVQVGGRRGWVLSSTGIGGSHLVDGVRYNVLLADGELLSYVAHGDLESLPVRQQLRDRGRALPDLNAAAIVEAIAADAMGFRSMPGFDEPGPDDLLDAISMIARARRDLDWSERVLISAAKRAGIPLERIGLLLGYKPSGAKQGAAGRLSRLGGAIEFPAGEPVEP